MASIREQILDAEVTALGAVGKPAGLTVHRFRTRPLSNDSLPAVVVYPLEELSEDPADHDAVIEETFRWAVQARVKASGTESPDEALDPVLVWAQAQVLGDREVGGLALDTRKTKTQWAAEELAELYGAAQVEFITTYDTQDTDTESQP